MLNPHVEAAQPAGAAASPQPQAQGSLSAQEVSVFGGLKSCNNPH